MDDVALPAESQADEAPQVEGMQAPLEAREHRGGARRGTDERAPAHDAAFSSSFSHAPTAQRDARPVVRDASGEAQGAHARMPGDGRPVPSPAPAAGERLHAAYVPDTRAGYGGDEHRGAYPGGAGGGSPLAGAGQSGDDDTAQPGTRAASFGDDTAQPGTRPASPGADTVQPGTSAASSATRAYGAQPDPEIECIVGLTPAQPLAAQALSGALHARLGKPLRWFGRTRPGAPWQLVAADSSERFVEIAGCLLLADRNGALSQAQLTAFLRIAGELGVAIDASVSAPTAAEEVQRAEALDRLCADLDVQIGLTVAKPGSATVPGTRLRGVAEAAGFRFAAGGRFEHVQEDTGAVLYTLQNLRSEPFTVESLRLTSTNGVVFVLDVPRVTDPARAFDQMKLAARRMAQTLAADLVDDNRRALDDASLAKIRAQVQAAANALAEMNIEPGSPRALALFSA
jgi:hypothetical protein